MVLVPRSILLLTLLVSSPALAAPSFQGLGGLGPAINSSALGISGDGTVVVGSSTSSSGLEAFRWTLAEGMIGLGDLAGGDFESGAVAANSDGTVIVGSSRVDGGREAFRWTAATGMVSIGDLGGGLISARVASPPMARSSREGSRGAAA